MTFVQIMFLIAACWGWYSFGVERQRNKYRQKVEQLVTAVERVGNTHDSLIDQRNFLLMKASQDVQKEYLRRYNDR